jgi:PKD repeat protein
VSYYFSEGGGILNDGRLAMTNTIVAGNSDTSGAEDDIYNDGVLTYGGSNLVQSVADLAPLGNYGGPTQTMPPLPDSPAIGAGSVAANTFSTDQRGYSRTQNGLIDLGAVELPTVQPFTASPASGTAPLSVQFNSANVDSDGSAITGWNWSFGDTQTGAARNPSHIYSTLGIFSPSLIVTNSLGLTLAVSGPSITVLPLLVTNSADSGPGTLRSAITNAASGAVITFDPSLSGATITLSNTLTINTNLTIDASALPGGLQINGNGSVQIFIVASNITVFLNSLTITNGYSVNYGGGIKNFHDTLTLNQCTLSGNSAHYGGGGGIYNAGGTLALNQCTLSGNSAPDGGGIYNAVGTLTLTNCTLSGNSVGRGGGIFNFEGTLTMNQCTLSGNSATNGYDLGGGIFNDGGTLALNQCTLSGNYSVKGGGIYSGGALGMTNTIVSGNSGSVGADIDYAGTLTYGGSNLVQSAYIYSGTITGPAPLTNAPNLAPLGNYGGPTQTMPPLPGSPAIGAGNVGANTFSTDQRGYSRTQNGLIDIGAVELQSPPANPPVLANITVPAGGGNGLQFTFTNAPAADFTVLTATNVSLALTNWTVLGEVRQVAPGQYQFTDPQAATNTGRFYRVRSP